MQHYSSDDFVNATGATPPAFVEPLRGWPLRHLIILDSYRPGVIAGLMSARPGRRQAVFASLAAGAMNGPEPFARLLGDCQHWHGAIWLAMLAEAFLTSSPSDLLSVAFGSCPVGLLSSLKRAGCDPLRPGSYRRLHTHYSDPKERRAQQLLTACETLTDKLLDVVEIIPECAQHPHILRRQWSVEQAKEVRTIITLALQHTHHTPATIWQSMAGLGRRELPGQLLEKLLRNFTGSRCQPDVSMFPGAVILLTGKLLREAGREFQNCLGKPEHLLAVTSGEMAFVTMVEPKVVAELRRAGEGWIVSGVFGPENEPLALVTRETVCQMFEEAGFQVMAGAVRADDLEAVRGSLRGGMFDALD